MSENGMDEEAAHKEEIQRVLKKDFKGLPREQILLMAVLNRGIAVLERIAAVMEKTEERVERQSNKMERMISDNNRNNNTVIDNN